MHGVVVQSGCRGSDWGLVLLVHLGAVAFYGHYDIQPAEEPDWRTNPFEMTAVDGYLCGRGTSDNKGPMLAFIYAVKVCRGCFCM